MPRQRGSAEKRRRDHRRRADGLRDGVRLRRRRRQGRARGGRADRPRQQRVVRRLDFGRPGRAVRGSRKGARRARRPPRVARLASSRARLRRPAPAARREVLPRRAARGDRRRHARSGRAPDARAAGAAQGRPRRPDSQGVRDQERARAGRGRRPAREGRRDGRSVSRLPRACRGGGAARRRAVRALAGTKGDLQSQDRGSVHRRRQHPDEPRRRRHRDADAALQVACAALLVSHHVSHADGTGGREDSPASSGAARR